MTLSFCFSIKYLRKDHRQNFSLLLDFTCEVAKDELEKHPEMRTIAMVELENNFPSDFSAKVLKCLPSDVAKIIINPHTHVENNNTMMFPKETLIIYIADKVDWEETFFVYGFPFLKNFPIVSHLSKHLVVSSDETKIDRTNIIFNELNVVQIYTGINQKVIIESDGTINVAISETFDNTKNFSKILFPNDKVKNLNGQEIFAVWHVEPHTLCCIGRDRPINKLVPYFDIIAEKLNATLRFIRVYPNRENAEAFWVSKSQLLKDLIANKQLDFYINYNIQKFDLESYNSHDWCFIAPLPKPFSIAELILILPLDKSCWMWLSITIAVSTLIWRISESHWGFAFGAFSYFMGQAQLIIRIRTNRLTMKILLQLLIFAIFIFSNGYQSIVTSFMLNPMQQKLLNSIDELLGSNMNIKEDWAFEQLYGDNPKYQKAKEDGRLLEDVRGENWTGIMIEMNFAEIQPCKMNKMRIELLGDSKSWRGIYLIDEVVYSIPVDLYTRRFHPLIGTFQQLMDRSFEAGLHQAWERFYWDEFRKGVQREKPDDEKEFLDFDMIIPTLYILFGFPAALLALLCEIFWKDFVMQLTKEYFERKWKEIFQREIKVEKIKPKVRRIQVKPAQRRSSL